MYKNRQESSKLLCKNGKIKTVIKIEDEELEA